MIYCPYTDRDLPEEEANREHVIPLSLGGCDGFEIPVHAGFNSDVGTKIDGAVANEFYMTLRRTEFDARGHSGKPPIAIAKKATYGDDNRPAQVQVHRAHGIRVWDARDREFKPDANHVTLSTLLDAYLPVRFAAKVALSAGYFAYGDAFRKHVDHDQLREAMRDDFGEEHAKQMTVHADHYLCPDPADQEGLLSLVRHFCSSIRGSVVVIASGYGHFSVGVGILGKYLAMITVPANTNGLPNEGHYTWGHVVAVADKRVVRGSWQALLDAWTTDDATSSGT